MLIGYVAEGYWTSGYAVEKDLSAIPTWYAAPTSTVQPSYPYVQYSDDQDISAFFSSYNTIAQEYLSSINALQLPIFSVQSGAALDWVALNLYGFSRPVLTIGTATITGGTYNSNVYNSLSYDNPKISGEAVLYPTTDDIFTRCLIWNTYTGDGKQFTIPWLKKRVMRFLNGLNNTAYQIDDTSPVSISFSGARSVTIHIQSSYTTRSALFLNNAQALGAVVAAQAVQLPFQFNFNVTY